MSLTRWTYPWRSSYSARSTCDALNAGINDDDDEGAIVVSSTPLLVSEEEVGNPSFFNSEWHCLVYDPIGPKMYVSVESAPLYASAAAAPPSLLPRSLSKHCARSICMNATALRFAMADAPSRRIAPSGVSGKPWRASSSSAAASP